MRALSLWQPWASLLVTRQPCDCERLMLDSDPRHHPDCQQLVKRIVTRSWPCPEKYWGQRMAFASTKREPDVGQQLGPYFVSRADNQSRSPVLAGPGHDLDLPLGCILGSGVVTATHTVGHLAADDLWTPSDHRPIPSFPGYEASLDGRIFTDADHRFPHQEMSPQPSQQGYPVVSLRRNGDRRPERIHALVAESWLSPVDGTYLVRHFDGDKSNNTAWNLRRGTDGDNLRDDYANGRHGPGRRLTDKDAEEIRSLHAAGWAYGALAEKFKVVKGTIGQIVNGDTYAKKTSIRSDDSLARNRWAWFIEDAAPTTERCPWCWGSGIEPTTMITHAHDLKACRVCRYPANAMNRPYVCEPIPVKGHQRIWEWSP